MAALPFLLGLNLLLSGPAETPKTVAPTTIKLAISKVTDNEALYVWEMNGPGWQSTRSSGYRIDFQQPYGEGIKSVIEVSLQAIHYKNGGMDVTMTRRMQQGKENFTASSQTYKFIGLPSMPLSKLFTVRAKGVSTVPGLGRIELAEVKAPASQFTNFEWRRMDRKDSQTVVYRKRVRIKDGQPEKNALLEPDAARMMKREDLWMSGPVSAAVEDTLILDFS